MRRLKIFLDTSVKLSGLASPTGGSKKLFDAARLKKLKLVTSLYAMEEVNDHLDKLNISPDLLKELLTSKTLFLVKNPTVEMNDKFIKITSDPNDAPILAAALLSGADALVSLDKKHILTLKVKNSLKPMVVVSPQDFWKWVRERESNSLFDFGQNQ